MSRTFPQKWFSKFSAVVIAGLTVGSLALPSWALSDKDEIEMGRHYRDDIELWLGSTLPDNAPETLRVRNIGRRFAHLSTRKVPYSFHVLADAKMLNAFALPGGPVYVTKKMVQFAKDDSELAAVLGHEVAHVQYRHAAHRYDSMMRARQMAQKLSVKVLGKTAGSQNEDLFMLGTYVAYGMWTRPYDRKQEMNADVQGVRWMHLLGYDTQKAVTLFQRYGKEREKIFGQMDPSAEAAQSFLSNHPSNSDRIARIKLLIREEKLYRPGSPAALEAAKAAANPTPAPTPSA